MKTRLFFVGLAVLLAAGISLAGEKGKSEEKSLTGWITDSHCGAKGAKEGHADCATKCVKTQGAKYALVTPEDGKVYVLDPQDKAAEHAGHHVKVKGTIEGDTLKVASIEMTGEQKGVEKEKEKGKEKSKS